MLGKQYLPTINIWNAGVQTALITGQLQLQCGQWIQCGTSKKSRYVGMHGNSIWAAHPEGRSGTGKSFRRLLNAHKGI